MVFSDFGCQSSQKDGYSIGILGILCNKHFHTDGPQPSTKLIPKNLWSLLHSHSGVLGLPSKKDQTPFSVNTRHNLNSIIPALDAFLIILFVINNIICFCYVRDIGLQIPVQK